MSLQFKCETVYEPCHERTIFGRSGTTDTKARNIARRSQTAVVVGGNQFERWIRVNHGSTASPEGPIAASVERERIYDLQVSVISARSSLVVCD